jgi:hypothetical protein
MTDLPSSVRIGFQDFTIDPYWETPAPANGEFRRDEGMIKYDSALPVQRVAATVLHEVIHGAWDMGRLGDGPDEEHAVTVLANQLAQVWRDNPELVAYLSEALGPRL